ncbi:MAG TPA: FTR1 family protein [Thermoplasmata archaeon]|jgi:high-affinity iron transporter|nr:FTR1 family protein [Thermoplasmata archaeon]
MLSVTYEILISGRIFDVLNRERWRMAVGIVPGLIVGLREGIEAALVIGIILAYLTKIGQKPMRKYVLFGAVAAIVASAVGAVIWALAWGEFGGTGEELFEGFAAILAVIVLTSMILWMMKAAKDIRKHVEQRIDALVDRRQVMGLASLAFIAVFREGVETILFMAGLAGATSTADLVAGVGIGLIAATFIGFGIYGASWKINLKRFFQITGIFLIIIAAGLFAFGVHELQGAGVLPWLSTEVYNWQTSFPDSDANPAGYLLRGLIGYNDNPTWIEGVAYASYWVFTVLVYLGIKTGRIAIVTRPLRQLWGALKKPFAKAPATTPRE